MGTLVELLLSLILAMTGVGRVVGSDLTAIAQQRVIEIQTDFSHSQMRPGTWEVLAWNEMPTGEEATRHAAEQWMGSLDHRTILTNGSLTAVGCAIASSEVTGVTRWWFACVLSTRLTPSSPSPSATSPAPAVAGPAGSSTTGAGDAGTILLPNTALPVSDTGDPPVPPGDAVPAPEE